MPASSTDNRDKGSQGLPPGYQDPQPHPAAQSYATQQPQQSYAPQYPQGQPYPPAVQPHPSTQSAAQIGEQYRAQLFAQCAQGIHQPTTKYGMCGIITAILCFPIGLICLFTDTEQKCDRCGIKLS